MRLYHYCCSHSMKGISEHGELRPHRQVALGDRPLVWLTDLDQPDRAALGLTSDLLDCDRTEHRVVVDTDEAVHWPVYARRLPLEMRRSLELAIGVLPMHWYVSEHPVPVVAAHEGLPASTGEVAPPVGNEINSPTITTDCVKQEATA